MAIPFSRRLIFVPLFAFSILSLVPAAEAQQATPNLGDDPLIAEAGIEIAQFASGLNFPMGLVQLPDNSLLVATSAPDGGSFYQSSGELIRLVDGDDDGQADDAGTVLASGLPGMLVAVRRIDDLVIVTSAEYGEEAITFLRRGEHWRDPLTIVDTLKFGFSQALHQTYGLTVRHSPGKRDSYDLVFNLGAHGNVDAGVPVNLSGLVSAELEDASLYMLTIRDDGTELMADPPVLLATGLRNASALLFDAKTGDLIIGENGMDTPGNDIVSLSADEIDVIPADKIGTEVLDFGFPQTYIDYATGEVVGTSGTQPVADFRPVDGSESEGIASLSPMPSSFPESLRGGYVAGFHGQFDSFGDDNEENPLVFVDLASGDKFDLISNDNPEVGHLDSLYATTDVLYVADICATGSLVEEAPCGVIYQIRVGE